MAATACGASAAAAATPCQSMFEQQRPLLASQTFEQFDQTEGAGFRRLADAGCYVEAARLIDAYAEHHGRHLELLRWHAAQMLANAGQYDAAVERARLSLVAQDRGDFRWNDYVRGTIAFLQRDKPALVQHRDAVAEAAGRFPANQPNLRILDRLLMNFDRPYAAAVNAAP